MFDVEPGTANAAFVEVPATFLSGARLWAESLRVVFRSSSCLRLLRIFLKKLLWVTLLTNAVCLLLLLPTCGLLLLGKLLASPFVTFSVADAGWRLVSTWKWALQFWWTVGPWIQLLTLRYVGWSQLDGIFLSVLRDLDPQRADELSRLRPEPATNALLRSMRRQLRMLSLYPLPWLLARAPLIGPLAWPATSLYILQQKVGFQRALACALLAALPLVGDFATYLLRTYFAVTLVARELLEPYFSRKPSARASWWDILAKNEPLLLGFAAPIYAMIEIPLAGPLLWVIAQGCAPMVLLHLR
ncbi:hypothetical protein CYMTET_44957 [Cymbomonas tetramitiformis]|uniref:Uncharacterized protein n=1 Tax=Cymbomonas tetramitiformis TaxID=36881 RepID=A0AAE0C0E0_9CHLO|nr:hypothetical protein CYMTET_44957 [Cymbomonas tetramitiformis]